MGRYVLKRVLLLIPIVLCVSFLVYFMMDLAPGDIIDVLGSEYSPEERAALAHELGYDRSVGYRYVLYMKDLLRGDLGDSYIYKQPVLELYLSRLPATLELAFAGVALSLIISIPLGIYAAMHAGKLGDNIATAVSLVGVSMPRFWFGLMLILLFSLKLRWLPSGTDTEGFKSLILPALTIASSLLGMMTRTTRSSMLDVLNKDYLDTARAKGTSERSVILKHALRNALIPIITVFGTQMGACVAGAVVTETVFTWPGIGRLTIDALNQRDTITVTGCIILTTIMISALMLIVDLLYAMVDPRIKAMYAKGGK